MGSRHTNLRGGILHISGFLHRRRDKRTDLHERTILQTLLELHRSDYFGRNSHSKITLTIFPPLIIFLAWLRLFKFGYHKIHYCGSKVE